MTEDRYTGGDHLVDTLAALGTRDIFMLCGNHVLPIAEAMRTRGIRTIATRAEASAVFAADAYGRIARRVGVAIVTGGPGMSNTVTGLITGYGNRSPLLVISGEPDQEGEGRGSQQEVDHLGLSAPGVKWHRTIRRPDHIEEALVEAFRMAQNGRTGPVHLTIPVDVQRDLIQPGTAKLEAATVAAGTPPRSFVEETAALLRAADRPVVVAGAGLWQAFGEDATRRLAEQTGLPIFSLDSARGIIPDSSPSAMGSADRGLNAAALLMSEADVVVVLGRALDFRLGLAAGFQQATIVHVDTELESLGRNARSVRACFGDPAGFVADLADSLGDYRVADGWLDKLRAERDRQDREVDDMVAEPNETLHPAAVARALGRVGNAHEAIYALDCGEFAQWCRQVIPSEAPGHWLRLGAQATCGAGLPFGIGAKVAAPDTPVLVVAGDGGIGYHLSELETAVRDGVPVVVVVGQDAAWGIEKNLQQGIYGPGADFTTGLNRVDLARVAEGWGATGIKVSDVDALEDAVKQGFAASGPTFIQIPVRTVPSAVTLGMIKRERDVISNQASQG